MSHFRVANTDFQYATAHEAMVKHDAYSWLQAFDREELQEFYTEILDIYCGAATSPDEWKNLDAVIREWHEGAIAIMPADYATC